MAEITDEIAVELIDPKQGTFFFAFALNTQQADLNFRLMLRLEAADLEGS